VEAPRFCSRLSATFDGMADLWFEDLAARQAALADRPNRRP